MQNRKIWTTRDWKGSYERGGLTAFRSSAWTETAVRSRYPLHGEIDGAASVRFFLYDSYFDAIHPVTSKETYHTDPTLSGRSLASPWPRSQDDLK